MCCCCRICTIRTAAGHTREKDAERGGGVPASAEPTYTGGCTIQVAIVIALPYTDQALLRAVVRCLAHWPPYATVTHAGWNTSRDRAGTDPCCIPPREKKTQSTSTTFLRKAHTLHSPPSRSIPSSLTQKRTNACSFKAWYRRTAPHRTAPCTRPETNRTRNK